MNNNNLKVWQGATLSLIWTNDESGALDATLTVSKDNVVVISKTEPFVGLSVDLTLDSSETSIDSDIYDYMVTINYTDGTVEKYPDVSGCEECELPTLTICDSNDDEVS